jgi:hypothetical protein
MDNAPNLLELCSSNCMSSSFLTLSRQSTAQFMSTFCWLESHLKVSLSRLLGLQKRTSIIDFQALIGP